MFIQFNWKNVFTRIFDHFSNCKYNLTLLFCDAWNLNFTLREKCPNTEFFLVRTFLYSDWIQEIYEVNLRIQSEYRKIRTRKNSVFGHFSRNVSFWKI